MAGVRILHEMIDRDTSFDRNQGACSEYERRFPRRDELRVLVVERLLEEPSTAKTQAGIEVKHFFRFIGRSQRDLICSKVEC